MHTTTPCFRFRQFTVWHDRCAMKVGTDGVLLGAWCPLPAVHTVEALDIGTGSGLVALMLAQRLAQARYDFHIQGIDIDAAAASQASQNFRLSPWSDRLTGMLCPLQAFRSSAPFQLIVSNPPFFNNSLKNPDPSRAVARHTDRLCYYDLLSFAAANLASTGIFALILPTAARDDILSLAHTMGLALTHTTFVQSTAAKPPKRVLMAFRQGMITGNPAPAVSTLVLSSATSPRSDAYISLTRDFYL